MRTILTSTPQVMGRWVAEHAAADLRLAIEKYGSANLVVATGASQFEVLSALVQQPDMDWTRVQGFHLDEYVGLSNDHPASFCRYLKERFVDHVPLSNFHYLDGLSDTEQTVSKLGGLIRSTRMDVAMVGIGENGHLAFNDPPADFETSTPYLVVELDEPCRMQQVGEGWFASLEEVPTHAMSMSVKQILESAKIYCSVPDERKAEAVRNTIEGEITAQVPASILKSHPSVALVIDEPAASRFSDESLADVERIQ